MIVTDEDAFQAAMDAEPQNWFLKQVFADWLEDGGDPRSIGYRALGVLKRDCTGNGRYCQKEKCPYWFRSQHCSDMEDLPFEWFDLLLIGGIWMGCAPNWHDRKDATRREIDDAAAIAFSKLPPERQAELLQMELVL